MASLGMNFDANQVAPAAPQGAIPPDHYLAAITKSEMKVTSKKDGSLLALEYTIQAGKYKGRKLFNNLNLNNKNTTAVEIAQAELSAICHAVGVLQINDSSQLHGISMCVKVGVEPEQVDDDTGKVLYPERNIVQGHDVASTYVGDTSSGGYVENAAATEAPSWATGNTDAPVQTATAPAKSAPSKAPPAKAAPAAKQYVTEKRMTAKAEGATYEAFLAESWTDDEMIRDGFMELVQVEVAPAGGGNPPWQAGTGEKAAPAENLAQASASSTEANPPWVK